MSATADERPRAAEALVVGAGIAGLAAARRLGELGYSAIVLEARQRVGGRIWTDDSLGLPLDLGASWIHGVRGNPLSELADAASAERVATDYESIAIYDVDGRPLSEAEIEEGFRIFENLMDQIEEWQEEFDSDVALQQGIEQYLAYRNFTEVELQRLQNSINAIIEHEYAADVKDLSLYWFDDAADFGGEDVLFPGGYRQITDFLAENLDIRLGHVVHEINYGSNEVRLTTSQGEFSAPKAIVTLPLGVLKSGKVLFKPALPGNKQKALQALGFGVLNKVYLKFPEAFWDNEAHLLGYISQEKGRFSEWVNFVPITGAPVLLGFNAGAYGLEIESLADKEIVAGAMATLRTIYGEGIPEPSRWLITRWHEDPFSGGSYSSLMPGASPAMYETLGLPLENALFFAGEATHRTHPATVHGAYLSGLRAADQLDRSLDLSGLRLAETWTS